MGLFRNGYVKSLILLCASALVAEQLGAQEAQKLPEQRYKLCGLNFSLEVADNPRARAIGMMFREGTQSARGMLFSSPEPVIQSFWMRNVPFDLDIGFFDETGRLINFHTMKAGNPLKKDEFLERYTSERHALFAVEVEAGFFAKQKSSCRLVPIPPRAKN
jgi:uncharacterized membrane protein (UPF0127 family)